MPSIRIALKRLYLRLGGTVVEFCKSCGQQQPVVWHADDDLWLHVIGTPAGVRCPECFTKDAARKGIIVYWRPVVQ